MLNDEEEKRKIINELKKSFNTDSDIITEKKAIKIIETYPNEIIVWKILADTQYRLSYFEKSLANYKKVYELGDKSEVVCNKIGLIFLRLKKSTEALDYFSKAISFNSNSAISYFNIGNVYRELSDYNKAYENFKKAAELDGKNKVFQNNFGLICRFLSKNDEALRAFQSALALDKNYHLALANIGYIHLLKGELKQAEEFFLKAFKSEPSDPVITNLIGTIYKNQGDKKLSMDFFLKSLNLVDKKINESIGLVKNTFLILKKGIKTNIGNLYFSHGNFHDGFHFLSEGSGYFSTNNSINSVDSTELPELKKINSNYEPHFIGMWDMDDPSICNDIIKVFDKRIDRHEKGEFAGIIQLDKKDTIDISVDICELDEGEDFFIAKPYIEFISKCYNSYSKKWSFLKKIPNIKIGRFNFQKYDTGKHFLHIHSERMSLSESHRVFAFMTYLNDVEEGGETSFHHYGIDITPKAGRTLIWPAEWTHAHSGGVVRKGEKYIATGWLEIHE